MQGFKCLHIMSTWVNNKLASFLIVMALQQLIIIENLIMSNELNS